MEKEYMLSFQERILNELKPLLISCLAVYIFLLILCEG